MTSNKFELPISVLEEDVAVIRNILTGLDDLGLTKGGVSLCTKYRVDVIPTGYLVRATLPSVDVMEIELEDLLFLQSISPARIEKVAIIRASQGGACEIAVRMLDHTQHIMITSYTTFSAARVVKRRRVEAAP
jgi:cephalosporin-C deacetylase-like acetyl esterase